LGDFKAVCKAVVKDLALGCGNNLGDAGESAKG
jgi:hypothetical protein